MITISRRTAIKLATAALVSAPAILRAQEQARVVIVGGGFGGASLARTLRTIAPEISVTLIEKQPRFTTCPFSNAVLGGLRDLDSISFGYDTLVADGVELIAGEAIAIDPDARSVRLADGESVSYDRLVLSPGVQMIWDAIEGYDAAAAEIMPHAWEAGPQTQLLADQLRAMEDGGVVLIASPPNPFRCPPGPYERASLIAHYLNTNKPRSKILIVDAKDSFSKQPLFEEAWAELYPGMIEWIPAAMTGRIGSVDPQAMSLSTDFDTFTADVANIIPPQRAGAIALALGLDEGRGYCTVDPLTFESAVVPGIHILGDAAIMGAMPKSGFSANSQAKACAHALVALIRGEDVADPVLLNTCYSLVAPEYGISVSGAYRGLAEIEGTGGASPVGAETGVRQQEARDAMSWYANITREMFWVRGV
ncbi:FCSD flavin-binding domain-containing protein [Pelagibacterium sp. H642]|uniref:FCSD flavin-binding domain-containing protein n=1 Tax=Pelagibacterium sp. H642 TaxID=1881069 RepID=UPI0028157763|nr:FCSD flavin-binding domain-containing protein [Pelagibacterium sp. H642]